MPSAIITGASRGIGRAAAECFAGHGFSLALVCDKNTEELEETRELCTKDGTQVISIKADVSSPSDVEKIFKKVYGAFGIPDVLVNNAGISMVMPFQDMSYEEWQRIIDVDLTSVFLMCRGAVDLMMKVHRGRIINVSSVWGNTGASCEAAYSAAKGGINSFTRAIGKELALSGIAVNAAAFGIIDTAMNSCFTKEELEDVVRDVPAGRMADPKEAGEFIYHIAQAPDYMTGQVIAFDGGWI
ncbi:MAG: SDR family NAD(P)-dependent oxidoreductase [Lachnospiraceae bacterium]|jgi:3-oxoacyl-[acyl-carrier protein] reductase|nr:SDR family NAD(P)-dependent oxidoreductase [Lachnospiraceae bacterium]MEE3460304.1 SDR family NAD(P)-dependent oxidoreductase [Lachnospiraceae bacterium]